MAIKRDAADAMFSDAVRLANNYTCEHCGLVGGKGQGTPQMDCAHIWGRANKSTRWDTMNALCLCRTCHDRFGGNPLDFTRWLESHVGPGYLELLNERRNKILKTNKALRKEIAKHYRQEIKLMEESEHDLVSWP